MVRMPSSPRIGAQCFMRGMVLRRPQEADAGLVDAARVISNGTSSLTPSAVSTSEAPASDDTERLPCLAIFTPAPAAISAAQVETLKVPVPSPPVPTMSTAPGGTSTPCMRARSICAAPVISSTVSPRTRSAIRKAPICAGVAAPSVICSSAVRISTSLKVAPPDTFWIRARSSCEGWSAVHGGLSAIRRRGAPVSRCGGAGARPASSRKLASSACPCSEAMLSGWNCTPCTGWVLCCSPMIRPSAVLAVTARLSGRPSRSTISEW